jgi:hypothetical protein
MTESIVTIFTQSSGNVLMKYSWPTINTNYPLWHLQCNESKHVNIWKTSADNEANVLMCLTVDSEFHYIVTVNGKQCELDWFYHELDPNIYHISCIYHF